MDERRVVPHDVTVDKVLDELVVLVGDFVVVTVERRSWFLVDQVSSLGLLLECPGYLVVLERAVLSLAVCQPDHRRQDVGPGHVVVLLLANVAGHQVADVVLDDVWQNDKWK